jgi:hypothetical protein
MQTKNLKCIFLNKTLLKLSFCLHYIVIFLFLFAGDLNITFADSNLLLEEAKDSHVLSAALIAALSFVSNFDCDALFAKKQNVRFIETTP